MRFAARFTLVLSAVCASACSTAVAAETSSTLHITALVPAGTPVVYVTGNQPDLGPWDPHRFAMAGEGTTRTAMLSVPTGSNVEFKFTLGSWQREAVATDGKVLPNCKVDVTKDTSFTMALSGFKRDVTEYLTDWQGSGVKGRLVYWRDVKSTHLELTRHVEIWLPPGYDDSPEKRYPVLYMHDGQNLFDPRIANTGTDWGVDECLVALDTQGSITMPIVVGIWNTDKRRLEYSPWHLGPSYAQFIIQELMPRVNSEFRTQTGAAHTAAMGSSMGGLISFWLCWQHPDVFGSAACLSTHWVWNGVPDRKTTDTPIIERVLKERPPFPTSVRLYFDYGTVGVDEPYEPYQKRVTKWLTEKGLREGPQLEVKKFEGAEHNEATWRGRLEHPMKFLYSVPKP